MNHKIQTNWKHTDSPNVQHASWGYFIGNEFHTHESEASFEDPPWSITSRENFPGNFDNSRWGVENKSAWFTLDTANDDVAIIYSY